MAGGPLKRGRPALLHGSPATDPDSVIRHGIGAAALVLSLAACGVGSPVASTSPSPTASIQPAVSPSAPSSPSATTVDSANALIKSTVTGAQPLLLPTAIPDGWSAQVTGATVAFFSVVYTSPNATKSVEFAIEVPNPPPPGPRGWQSNPNFHRDGHSLYQVDDASKPTSDRWLIWNEPGIWSEPNGLPGVPYFLVTKGMTETEFWMVANSVG